MSTRSPEDRAASRAEARRRARLVARGELGEDEGEVVETQPEPRGSFLSRLFPAAPPLPNKPDPLAGFDAATPSYEQIATRAYFIALERGFQTDPLSDWLLAERELRGVSAQS